MITYTDDIYINRWNLQRWYLHKQMITHTYDKQNQIITYTDDNWHRR